MKRRILVFLLVISTLSNLHITLIGHNEGDVEDIHSVDVEKRI
ncbi:hypothetical protein [Heyndrickxia oleronia]|uniref:Uncharacterized protein n=1 Tax=Heyndrickxia oleronia TaxID=38875 RepID=A0AAW6T515_9BACI|nr:hypothetical protein [Heyndrickxia oleronia]MDH5163951.1 hypothetical protein [Heyndrickxia oleronia]